MDRTEHRFFPSGRLPGGDFRVRRQSCQQDGAEQQRERAAPPGHVCASAYGGVSGAQSRFAGADCPAGQPCRPADRRAHCPADRRAPCRADFRVESVHVSPPFLCGSVCAAALFHAGGGRALRGRAFCIPEAEPGRHWLSLPRGRGPSQTPPSLATDSSISPGPPSPWLPALFTSAASQPSRHPWVPLTSAELARPGASSPPGTCLAGSVSAAGG